MDTNTGESPGYQSQYQQLGNSPSEEEMGHWTPMGIEPRAYDDDDDQKEIQGTRERLNTHLAANGECLDWIVTVTPTGQSRIPDRRHELIIEFPLYWRHPDEEDVLLLHRKSSLQDRMATSMVNRKHSLDSMHHIQQSKVMQQNYNTDSCSSILFI